MFSITLMDLHKTMQLIVKLKNTQVPIAHIVKDKLLTLRIWLGYILLMIVEFKNLHVIAKTKNLHVPWQFWSWHNLHKISSTSILGGQNLMNVLQKDEFFNKLKTQRKLKFQNHTLLLKLCFLLFPHNYSK